MQDADCAPCGALTDGTLLTEFARRGSRSGPRRAAARTPGARFRTLTVALGAAALACTEASVTAVAQDAPRIVSVRQDSLTGAAQRLTVDLDRPGPVSVTYGPEGGASFRLDDETAATRHALVLAHVLADTPHVYAVTTGADTVRGRFRTTALPPALAALRQEVEGHPTAPLVLLETGERTGFRGLVALDRDSRVVWYCDIGGLIHGALRRHTGTWVVVDPRYGLREIDATCSMRTGLPRSPGRTIHHDVAEAPDGSILYLAREERAVGDSTLTGDLIRRWTPETGADEEVWSPFGVLDPATDWGEHSRTGNWLHANSLAVGPRGNLVVSLAHLNQVISITPDLSGLEWRLGGPDATLPVVEGLPFSGQHTADEIAPGRVLMFDNGLDRDEAYSRAVEYALDADGAREAWSFRPARDNWSRVVGSARRLPGGNTLVTFGASDRQNGSSGPIEIYEVTADGTVVWHFVAGGHLDMIYRATPISTIAGEHEAGGGGS